MAVEGDVNFHWILSTTPDGEVLLDFQRLLDHIKLSPDTALDLAEALVQASKDARPSFIAIPQAQR